MSKKLLDNVNVPADLQELKMDQLQQLADEVRSAIIEGVSRTGGHLAANLGVVELTVALLKSFAPPADQIVWDVSHQSYAYKILTGRKHLFGGIRQTDGISGFLKREESEYDAFGAGHAGTALSAALGMAYARDQRGSDEHVVAVIGDASAGCGITFEAMNDLAGVTDRLIVVLNDNEMSIDANVGSISAYLGSLLTNPRYNRYKSSVETLAGKMKLSWLRSGYYKTEEAVKSLFLKSVIFEEFGLRYAGPVNGHDIPALVNALTVAKSSTQPILLHVATQKGKGYSFAEKRPDQWHGTGQFNVETGCPAVNKPGGYSAAFGDALEKIAEQDDKVVAITAAMCAGTGLSGFAERYPSRFFDVGIAEEHGAVFAAGLATSGLKPVFAVYSTFFQRCIDALIHDVCLQNLPVVFCLDRAGIVGPDGPTHHGVFDIALSCSVPNLTIMQPACQRELGNMLFSALQMNSPVIIRYPKGGGEEKLPEEFTYLEPGRASVIREPARDAEQSAWLWALGDMIPLAESASELLEEKGIGAGVVNPRFVLPLDTDLLAQHSREAGAIVTLENGMASGGFGSVVEEQVCSRDNEAGIVKIGWPRSFIEHGKSSDLFERWDITPEAVCERVCKCLKRS